MKLIDIFLRNRTAANVVMTGIICLGLIALTQIRRETFPSSELDTLRVTAEYKGASPEEVENSVLKLIEERCVGVRGFKSVEGSATEGRAVVNIELEEGTDTLAALMELRDQVNQITAFPPEVENVVTTEVKRRDMVQTLVVYGDVPEKVLKAHGEKLRDELLTRRIATEITVEATRRPEIHIMVSEAKLREHGLTVDEIARRVAQSSINVPVGEISTTGGKFLLRIKDEKRKPDEFLGIPVAVSPGKSEVLLGAIARVERTWEEVEVGARYNGKPAVIIQVDKNERQDTISVAKAVGRHLAEYREKLPEQIKVEIFRDQSERIGQRLGILVENGIMGLILVFFVLWFFTSSRVAFWVTWGIPVSFLGTIFAMWIVGHTLNMITMFGLLMVLGMLVDDAVVIAENIFAHRQRGESIFNAGSRGVTEVFWPVIASSLTTIGAFVPLMFVGGRMGRTMGALPWVVVAALILSSIEAFLSMPRHLKHAVETLPRNRDSGNGIRTRINKAIEFISEKWIGRLSEIILKHRYWVLGASLAVLIGTAGMLVSGRILFTFFPTPETNSIIARVRFPVGTPALVTQKQVSELESALKKVESKLGAKGDKDKRLIQRVLVRFGETTVHAVRGGHLAQVEVELLDAEIRDISSNKFISAWHKHTIRTPGVSTLTFGRAERGVGGRELDMRLVGKSWQELNAAAKEVTDVLATTRGISNVDIGLRPGKTELRLRVKEQGKMLGLTAASLAGQVRDAFHGAIAARFQDEYEEVTVRVVYPRWKRVAIDDLHNLTITLSDGKTPVKRLPLLEVAELQRIRGWAEYTHLDRERCIAITADIDEQVTTSGKVIESLQPLLQRDIPGEYPGVRVRMEGERATQKETFESLGMGAIFGLSTVLLVLVLVTGSWKLPFLVLSVVPIALAGAVWGHVLMGYKLTMLGTMASIGLAGVVVNDAILYLEFYKKDRNGGAPTFEALVNAAKSRFRPIIMTTVTTVAGLLPMLTETSIQAQFLIPMAITLSFGLMAGTVGTLLLLPALLQIFEDLKGSHSSYENPEEKI